MKKNDIEYLKNACHERPYLVHARNIITKSKNKDAKKAKVLNLFGKHYLAYLKENLSLSGYSQEIITKRVSLLNKYYKVFDDFDASHKKKVEKIFSSKSKFRPTVLEEFLAIVLYSLVEDLTKDLNGSKIQLGSVEAYANLYFYGKNFSEFAVEPSLGFHVKDQDFAIFRNVKIQVDDKDPRDISVPVVAMECKTYVDKTMFEGSAATAEKLKSGNPYTMFGIVAETYEIDRDFIPAYSRVDQVYVLRKGSRKGEVKPVDEGVVCRIVNDVKKHLTKPWVDVEKKLNEDGWLI